MQSDFEDLQGRGSTASGQPVPACNQNSYLAGISPAAPCDCCSLSFSGATLKKSCLLLCNAYLSKGRLQFGSSIAFSFLGGTKPVPAVFSCMVYTPLTGPFVLVALVWTFSSLVISFSYYPILVFQVCWPTSLNLLAALLPFRNNVEREGMF